MPDPTSQPDAGTYKENLGKQFDLDDFEDWTRGEAGDIHSALSTAGTYSHFDKQRAEFVPRKLLHDLEDIIGIYADVNPVSGFDYKSCTREDVLLQAQNVEEVYRDFTRARTRVGAYFRQKGPSLARNLEPWLELIPEEYGAGVIQGALGLILNAITRTSENREKIFQFLQQAPRTYRFAAATQKLFLKDAAVRQALEELYEALIGALATFLSVLLPRPKRSSIRFLEKRSHRNKRPPLVDSFLKAEATGEDIDDALGAVEEARKGFDEAAKLASMKLAVAHSQTGDSTNREVKATRQTAHLAYHEARAANEGVGGGIRTLQEFQQQFLSIEHEMGKISMAQAATEARTGIYCIYQDYRTNAFVKVDVYDQGQTTGFRIPNGTAQVVSTPNLAPEDLSDMLGTHFGASASALTSVLGKSHAFRPEQLGRANWLLNEERFKGWLAGFDSGILLVEGYCGSDRDGHASPLSVFCATLARTLPRARSRKENGPNAVLHFFCGLAASSLGDNTPTPMGPAAMLCSLVIQLVEQMVSLWPEEFPNRAPDLSFIRAVEGLERDVNSRRTRALFWVLRRLLDQLPAGVDVYIILDDISRFETELGSWKTDMRDAVDELRSLCRDHQGFTSHINVKVLMTAAERSTDVLFHLRQEDRISLQAGYQSYITMSAESSFIEQLSVSRQ